MNDFERYEFDRTGYLVIKNLLSHDELRKLNAGATELEAHAMPNRSQPPRKAFPWGTGNSHRNERGYHVHGGINTGETLVVEDFWNFSSAFDGLLCHARTESYISNVVLGKATINNSELRIRFTGNNTGTHMGGPIDHKYRYGFHHGKIDCMMVRMIYFLHDVSAEQGAFCVVPGTHKTNFSPTFKGPPEEEPGMLALEVKAGDGILFTENLRHGGFTNRSAQVRRTLHVGYGPNWMMSQNFSTMEERPHITPETRARLSREQNELFVAWPTVLDEAR